MEDKNEKTQEAEEKPTPDKPEGTVKTEDNGDASKEKTAEPNLVDQAKVENDRKAELLEKESALLDRKEKLQAEEMVGGRAGMSGADPKPAKLTDTEYAEALERGEVDPLKEDGFAQ